MKRLTDKTAIKIALLTAIDTEESLIDAYSNMAEPEKEEGVIIARRYITAFRRVLDRYYPGATVKEFPKGPSISIFELMNTPDREFNKDATE